MQHEWYTGLNSGTVVPYFGDSVCTSQPREWLHWLWLVWGYLGPPDWCWDISKQ